MREFFHSHKQGQYNFIMKGLRELVLRNAVYISLKKNNLVTLYPQHWVVALNQEEGYNEERSNQENTCCRRVVKRKQLYILNCFGEQIICRTLFVFFYIYEIDDKTNKMSSSWAL